MFVDQAMRRDEKERWGDDDWDFCGYVYMYVLQLYPRILQR